MCGIVAYVGHRNAEPILIEGLKRLEYRGYDSAGVAIINAPDQGIDIVRSVGRVSVLENRIAKNARPMTGTLGIAHTRWATHGKVTENNAHPHTAS
ncbi:MAG: glutamine--fructose-6-phosphate aminotransferase, partial [Phycisphaeraceae bacterium]